MANIQGGSNTINVANIDTGYNLNVTLPTNDNLAGKARIMSENDPGSIVGSAYLKSPETSTDFRLRVGTDSLFDNDFFSYPLQNTSKHKYIAVSSMAFGWGGGFVTTNSALTTAAGAGGLLSTYRYFPTFGASSTYFEFSLALTALPTTNTIIDIGAFIPGALPTFAPTDGVYFRISSAGLSCVMNNLGTETSSVVPFTFTPNTVYKFTIAASDTEVEFWINDVLYLEMDTPSGNGAPALAGSLPFSLRHAIAGGSAGATLQAKLSNYTVSVADMDNHRLWPSVQVGMGNSSIQGSSGFTQGQTANQVNSTSPVLGTLSNTAASYTTLGGNFMFNTVAGAETDYALFGYQNVLGTGGITSRNLVIRGAWIDSMITGSGINFTTPTALHWSLGINASTVSLATAEGPSGRAPRRIHLGYQTIPISGIDGFTTPQINTNLDAPIAVEPSGFFHVILKMPRGAATPAQVVRGSVGINAYWE